MLKEIKPNDSQMCLNSQKGNKTREGKEVRTMSDIIAFGIFGFITMILGILAQVIPPDDHRE
jgi:hypothetical protein